MIDNRDFKGVWIDKEIWLDERLTALEKVVLVEIDSLDGEQGCWASNEYLAKFCQCSVGKVSRTITKLIDLGYIEVASFDGRKRKLQSRLAKKARQTCKKSKADCTKSHANNIDNNKANNKEDNNIYVQEFEELWEIYPRKVGKREALTHYKVARKEGTSFEEVKQGIENYKAFLKKMNWGLEYTKMGSSYFCKHLWENEYEVSTNDNMGTDDDEYGEWLDSLERE